MRRTVGKTVALMAITFAGIQAASAQESIAKLLQAEWEGARKQMVQIAGAMPSEKYQYRATPEVRSYGEIVAHIAGENITWMEMMAGVPEPGSFERFDHLKTRTEIMKALSDSYDYGAKVLSGINDQQALENAPFKDRQRPRWWTVMHTTSHSKEHFGNLVTYLRLNNIVPPSTLERAAREQ
ncbi:MAG: DinB family protein [Acidobacteria bacterium]|nr:DinB family protein [Acidobacteriota bacterium]